MGSTVSKTRLTGDTRDFQAEWKRHQKVSNPQEEKNSTGNGKSGSRTESIQTFLLSVSYKRHEIVQNDDYEDIVM